MMYARQYGAGSKNLYRFLPLLLLDSSTGAGMSDGVDARIGVTITDLMHGSAVDEQCEFDAHSEVLCCAQLVWRRYSRTEDDIVLQVLLVERQGVVVHPGIVYEGFCVVELQREEVSRIEADSESHASGAGVQRHFGTYFDSGSHFHHLFGEAGVRIRVRSIEAIMGKIGERFLVTRIGSVSGKRSSSGVRSPQGEVELGTYRSIHVWAKVHTEVEGHTELEVALHIGKPRVAIGIEMCVVLKVAPPFALHKIAQLLARNIEIRLCSEAEEELVLTQFVTQREEGVGPDEVLGPGDRERRDGIAFATSQGDGNEVIGRVLYKPTAFSLYADRSAQQEQQQYDVSFIAHVSLQFQGRCTKHHRE